MRSRSATERPIGPATAQTASKPGFGSTVPLMMSPTNVRGDETLNLPRTYDASVCNPAWSWLEPIDATVPGGDTYAPTNIRADAERCTVCGEQGALTARGASRGVRC